MKAFWSLMFFVVTSALLIIVVYFYWLQIHWFWASCLALSTAGAITLSSKVIVRCIFARQRALRQIAKNAEPEHMLRWLSRTHLGEGDAPITDDEEAGIMFSLFMLLAILSFYFLPWAPNSLLGHISRALVYILSSFIIAGVCTFIVFDWFVSKQQKRVVELVKSSKNRICKSVAFRWRILNLLDTDKKVRREAQAELKKVDPNWPKSREAIALVPDFLERLGDEDSKVVKAAEDALDKIHPKWRKSKVAKKNSADKLKKIKEKPGSTEFIIPEGRFMDRLASQSEASFDSALDEIASLAASGDRTGLDEMETFVRANRISASPCTFYEPGRLVARNATTVDKYPARLFELARSKGVFESPKKAQDMIIGMLVLGERAALLDLLQPIEAMAGWREARSFEILYAHAVSVAKYKETKEVRAQYGD